MDKEKKANGYLHFFIGLITGVLILAVIGIYSSDKNPRENLKNGLASEGDDPVFRIVIPRIPDNLEFAGEKVPLQNFEVKERVDREFLVNAYWYSSTILGMKRANRWFPVIEPILKKYGVPDDFKYMPVIESNLYNSTSYAGAVGFWQLTEDVAKRYGLEIDDQVDERYNVEKSTEAACMYLLSADSLFHSWTLAAAAFNMGRRGLEKQIEKQGEHNYYNLLLSDQTSRYVARLLAIKEIFTHPHNFGFYISKYELYPPLKTYEVKVNTPVENWTDFAKSYDINYKILKYYNPWLRDVSLKNKKRITYEIEIPIKGSIDIIDDDQESDTLSGF